MIPDCTALLEAPLVGALMALKPMSYVIRLGFAVLAFGAAMDVDRTVARVIGFVWLLLTGAGLLFVGIQKGTVVDIVLGIAALGAAGYSWWYTRSQERRPRAGGIDDAKPMQRAMPSRGEAA